MPHLKAGLNLVQKVALTSLVFFVVSTLTMGIFIALTLRATYLNQQITTQTVYVNHQANRHLTADDILYHHTATASARLDIYRQEVSTPNVLNVNIYSPNGTVISSDNPSLLGQSIDTSSLSQLKPTLDQGQYLRLDKPLISNPNTTATSLSVIYQPLIFDDATILGFVEITTNLSRLNAVIVQNQTYTVAILTLIILTTFIILFLIIRKASLTLVIQDQRLKEDILKEKEYSKTKTEFITISSHQLRTPATQTNWALELLEDDLKHKLTVKQKELLENAKTSNSLLVSIINNMLYSAQIKPDYFTYHTPTTPLKPLIQKILTEHKPLISTKHLKLDLNIPTISLPQRPDSLEFVIGTLITNALDYSKPESQVTITVTQNDHQLQLHVKDTGIGIPKAEQPKIFTSFFRATNAIEQKNVGGGLSLYIAKKVTLGYHGDLTFVSSNTGTIFTLTLPITKPSQKM